jgi:four helix bundle protein
LYLPAKLHYNRSITHPSLAQERNLLAESFKELLVWQRAIQMTIQVYNCTAQFPDSERFGLINQLRRAAVSVASNIAEGYGRSTRGEYLQFLGHARGSICEVETQLYIARSLKFASDESLKKAETLCDECGRVLFAMIQKLKKPSP